MRLMLSKCGYDVNVSRFACGMSAAMKSTPDSIKPDMKLTLRARRASDHHRL
jgi:hypothetical protein